MFRSMFGAAVATALLAVSLRPVQAQNEPSVPMPSSLTTGSSTTSNSTASVPKNPATGSSNASNAPSTGEKSVGNGTSGKKGGDKFAGLYETYASAWNNPKDLKIAAQHKNRYDVIIFGKKYQKVAGHKIKVKKQPQSKAVTDFDVELLDNGIALNGTWSRSFNIFEVTAQVFVGPVPVVISCGVGANFIGGVTGNFGLVGTKEFGVNAFGSAGIGVSVAVGIGFNFGSLGVEGQINAIQAVLTLGVKYDGSTNVRSDFNVTSSGEVNLVAKIAFIKKKYNLYKSPDKVWASINLLDYTF